MQDLHPPPPPSDDSDIESLLMKRLMEPLSTPRRQQLPQAQNEQSQTQPDSVTPRKRIAHLGRRRKRPRPERVTQLEAIRNSFAEKSNDAQEAALALAMVRPLRTLTSPNKATSPSTQSTRATNSVIKVREFPQPMAKNTPTSGEQQPQQEAFTVDASRFVDTHRREVGRFGSQALHRRDRNKYELAQLIKLGCRKPKGQKMPIALLQKHRKRNKMKAQKKKEQDLASGMLLRSKRK
ncbi:hypothetical protein BWQ96_01568 [Gracilariopsis chorda]|uniref:Uncharacterized protein n=1 Tax=Gracilariopsis chorda TaxID=448386 RepID=A0A2V3J2N9_9FLOR|nr:hypothetical protein BWQ96_01568 [Gracilariopsis chorda]|eukprot:PXF48716.1 hypothetical protein BWQ96_01568 [Gracilariopsis chorda]